MLYSARLLLALNGHSSPLTTAKYTKMTEQAEQNNALMLNALVEQLNVQWVKS